MENQSGKAMIFDNFESLNEAISGLRSESRLLDNDAEVDHQSRWKLAQNRQQISR